MIQSNIRNNTRKPIKHKKLLIVFLLFVFCIAGIKLGIYYYKKKEADFFKPYQPQHDLEWYTEKINDYFGYADLGAEFNKMGSGMINFYFEKNPGICEEIGSYFLDIIFSEEKDFFGDPSNFDEENLAAFNRRINDLYYASIIYDDIQNYVDSILQGKEDYLLEVNVSVYNDEKEVMEFDPEIAWEYLKQPLLPGHSKSVAFYLLMDEAMICEEGLDLEWVCEQLFCYVEEYLTQKGIEKIYIYTNVAKTKNLEDYQPFNIRDYFISPDSDFYSTIVRRHKGIIK